VLCFEELTWHLACQWIWLGKIVARLTNLSRFIFCLHKQMCRCYWLNKLKIVILLGRLMPVVALCDSENNSSKNAVVYFVFGSIPNQHAWFVTMLICSPIVLALWALKYVLFQRFPFQGLPSIDAKIKWPNDLYLNGSKVGGILCTSTYKSKKFNVSAGNKLFLSSNAIQYRLIALLFCVLK